MKLGELRGLIRKTKGNPWFDCYPFPGTENGIRFYLQKTPLLEELDRVYPGGKTAETHLDFDVDTGQLKPADSDVVLRGVVKSAAEDDVLDLDDTPVPASDDSFDDLLV